MSFTFDPLNLNVVSTNISVDPTSVPEDILSGELFTGIARVGLDRIRRFASDGLKWVGRHTSFNTQYEKPLLRVPSSTEEVVDLDTPISRTTPTGASTPTALPLSPDFRTTPRQEPFTRLGTPLVSIPETPEQATSILGEIEEEEVAESPAFVHKHLGLDNKETTPILAKKKVPLRAFAVHSHSTPALGEGIAPLDAVTVAGFSNYLQQFDFREIIKNGEPQKDPRLLVNQLGYGFDSPIKRRDLILAIEQQFHCKLNRIAPDFVKGRTYFTRKELVCLFNQLFLHSGERPVKSYATVGILESYLDEFNLEEIAKKQPQLNLRALDLLKLHPHAMILRKDLIKDIQRVTECNLSMLDAPHFANRGKYVTSKELVDLIDRIFKYYKIDIEAGDVIHQPIQKLNLPGSGTQNLSKHPDELGSGENHESFVSDIVAKDSDVTKLAKQKLETEQADVRGSRVETYLMLRSLPKNQYIMPNGPIDSSKVEQDSLVGVKSKSQETTTS